MKNTIRYLLVLLIGIIVIPTSVFAKEKNVTYFMMYPDGSQEVTENYEDTINLQEKLIFTTTTDSSGKVIVCDWKDVGSLRIVQHVPEGYQSDKTEEKIELSKTSFVQFVDIKGVNPTTNRSFLFIPLLFSVVFGGIYAFTKNKKVLYLIPILFTFFIAYHVSADDNCFVVQVVDGEGRGIEGVQIDIYGIAEIEEAPAVKFIADGGTFFDGKEAMYFKLPNEMSEIDEFFDSLSDDEYNYFVANSKLVYREDYYPDGYDFPEYFVNGTVVPMKWHSDLSADVIKVVGNGGVLDFFGLKMEEAYFYRNSDWPEIAHYFERDGYYYLGFDRSITCSDPIDRWAFKSGDFTGKVYYLCWDTSIDGIIVNNHYIFAGNTQDCFQRADFYAYDDSFEFREQKGDYYLNLIRLDDGRFAFSDLFQYVDTLKKEEDASKPVLMDPYPNPYWIPIDKIEIIDHKKNIVTLTSDDFEVSNGDEGVYIIKNSEKSAIIEDFYKDLDSYCVSRPQ